MRRLPPLNALRAFEAAARHLTFTSAAGELHVTHGAVSRQILTLEDALGARLFLRGPRGLKLTVEGEKLAGAVSSAFQMLQVAVSQVRGDADQRAIRLSVPPTFAMRWLIPRLGSLHVTHPTLRLDISTSTEPVDLGDRRYDAAIRRIEVAPKGWTATPIVDGRSVAVCSPAYRKRHDLASPRDLSGATLVVTRSEPHAWQDWLRRCRVKRPGDAPTLVFDELYFALQAALDSLGVALVPSAIVGDEVRLGRLEALSEPDPKQRRSYALLAPRASTKRAVIAELGDWLRAVGPAMPSLDAADRA